MEYKSQRSKMIRPTGFWASDGGTGGHDDWLGYANFTGGRAVNFDLFDIDGDGRLELLCGHPNQLPDPVVEVWRNIGTVEEPVFCYEDILPWTQSYRGVTCRFVRNEAFDGCLWSRATSGSGIHYFQRVKEDYTDPESYRDTGPLPDRQKGADARAASHGEALTLASFH